MSCVEDGEWSSPKPEVKKRKRFQGPDRPSLLPSDDHYDLAMSCIEDGEWTTPKSEEKKKGKRFSCTRCGMLFRRTEDIRPHLITCKRETHPLVDYQLPSTSNSIYTQNDHSNYDNLESLSLQTGIGRIDTEAETSVEAPLRPQEPPYTIRLRSEKKFAKKAAISRVYEVKFNENWRGERLEDLEAELLSMFNNVIHHARGNLADNDLGCVVIRHDSLANAIVVPLRKLQFLDSKTILEYIMKTLASHNELKLDSSFQVDVGVIDLPKGAGSNHKIINAAESGKLKKSIVIIRNQDNLCLARSIAVDLAKMYKKALMDWDNLVFRNPNQHWVDLVIDHKQCSPRLYENMKKPNSTVQYEFAKHLTERAGLSMDHKVSLADIPNFERAIGCEVFVISAEMGNKFLRKGDDLTLKPKVFVYLLEQEQHFHAIPKVSGFFGLSYYCDQCLKPYSKVQDHECDMHCIVCKVSNCKLSNDPLLCEDCHMTCRSKTCFDRHKEQSLSKKNVQKPSQCEQWKRCPNCLKVLKAKERTLEQHICGEYKCKLCKTYVPNDHLCYHHPVSPTKQNISKYLFFDFECTQDEITICEEGYVPSECSISNCKKTSCEHRTLCSNCHKPSCGRYEHKPNFLVAQSACNLCKDKPITDSCNHCGSRCENCDKINPKTRQYIKPPCKNMCGLREIVFKGDTTGNDFCSWLVSAQHRDFVCFAHNFKGYDSYFILSYLIQNSILPHNIIYNGSKVMSMTIERGLNIRLLDSLSFFNTKLANLPKMFKLEELKKGIFPHFWNKRNNQTYVGPYPDPSYYGIDFMSQEDREDFLVWYETQKDKIFDFAQEIESYCKSDVDILRRSVMVFCELLMNITRETKMVTDPQTGRVSSVEIPGVDPTQSITVASVCMNVFKQKFLHPYHRVKLSDVDDVWVPLKNENGNEFVHRDNTWVSLETLQQRGVFIIETSTLPSPIALVPSEGYTKKDQYSQASIQWLEWLMHSKRIYIRHALNEGEFYLPGHKYRADGYCRDTKTIYQYDGCRYHGCRQCHPHDRDTTILPRTQQTISELYALTVKRDLFWKSHGFKVIRLWEHEYLEQLKKNEVMQRYVQSLDLQTRLDVRDSFFGGRTNATKLSYEADKNGNILYQDFTSLYPSVNKYGLYPVGHPTIITKDFKNLDQYFGIAKVKVLPPRGLYHPVLPYRSNEKLKFALCRTCADAEQQEHCEHSNEERCFIGTWCTPELQKALEKSYEIQKIYEIYHWAETTQYDTQTKTGGLFAEYINTFLKIKQESSDWPKWCKTEADKVKYVQEYETREGIRLDPDKIEKNPGLRALSKLMLNSFWGKYGQRSNMMQSKFINQHDLESFYTFLTDPSKNIHNFHILTENVLQLHWSHEESSFVPENGAANIFIATFTTCHARLKLYDLLDMLQERVLYYDTDSVIFVSRPGDKNPPLGDYLGELTDELEGDSIQTFVSGGPKNYAYRTKKGKETCKVRGFTLNHKNAQLINFEAVKNMVLNPKRDGYIIVTNPSKISRDKVESKIYNRREQKMYRIVYTKRVIQHNLDTLPYGY